MAQRVIQRVVRGQENYLDRKSSSRDLNHWTVIKVFAKQRCVDSS